MPNFGCIFVSGTYLVITGEEENCIGCILIYIYIYANMLDLYAHVAYWLCDLCLECSGLICDMIYVKYVYSVPC